MHLHWDYIIYMKYFAIFRPNTLHELASQPHRRSVRDRALRPKKILSLGNSIRRSTTGLRLESYGVPTNDGHVNGFLINKKQINWYVHVMCSSQCVCIEK